MAGCNRQALVGAIQGFKEETFNISGHFRCQRGRSCFITRMCLPIYNNYLKAYAALRRRIKILSSLVD